MQLPPAPASTTSRFWRNAKGLRFVSAEAMDSMGVYFDELLLGKDCMPTDLSEAVGLW